MAKDKKAKRRAEKLRRKAWKSAVGPNPRPIHIEPGAINVQYGANDSPSELIKKVEQALLHEADPTKRWTVSTLNGKASIHDELTGFYAVYGLDSNEELLDDIDRLNGGDMAIDVLSWQHRSGAAVLNAKTEFEHEFFWALISPHSGYAILDRHTGQVHPISVENDEQALALAKDFNWAPEERLKDCLKADHSVHFIDWKQWLYPEPEDESLLDSELGRVLEGTGIDPANVDSMEFINPVGHIVDPFDHEVDPYAITSDPPKPERTSMYSYIDESDEEYAARLGAALGELSEEFLATVGYKSVQRRDDPSQWEGESDEDYRSRMLSEGYNLETIPAPAAAATETPVQKPLRILVAGSSAWRWMGLVGEMIQDRWNSEGNPPLVIQTSGSPYGAEAAAQKLAEQVADVTHVTIDDMNVNRETTDFAFVFQTDESRQIDQLLSRLIEQKVPYHSVRERRPDDRWRAR